MPNESSTPTDPRTATDGDEAAKYRFFGAVRRGYRPSTAFSTVEAEDGVLSTEGEIDIAYTVTGRRRGDTTTDTKLGSTTLDTYGPRDIAGLDTRQIVRREPAPGTDTLPPNYFPLVEFDTPDLPWLFSPTKADTSGRNLPWLRLITVEKREGVSVDVNGEGPLPTLTVGGDPPAGEALPPADQAWAWAHTQVVGSPQRQHGRTLSEELAADSITTLARLLSPRNLSADTQYIAALVPTFETGRLVGLGRDPGNAASEGELAWGSESTPAELHLPVYDHWEFETARKGDFEYLVRKLEPENLSDNPEIGTWTVDASDPGPEMLEAASTTVEIPGALGPVGESGRESYPDSLQAALRGLLNRPAEIQSTTEYPAVGPPIYGQWHAQRDELVDESEWDVDENQFEWFYDLNLEPGFRVPAAIGAGIVQDKQEQLMASAWEQVGEIRAANRLLSMAQISRAVTATTATHLQSRTDTARLLAFTEPSHDRVLRDGTTAAAHLQASSFPTAVLSPAFRRLTGRRSVLNRRLSQSVETATVVEGLLDGSVSPPAPTGGPGGIQTIDESVDMTELCERAKSEVEPTEPVPVDDRVETVKQHLEGIETQARKILETLEKLRDLTRNDALEADVYEEQANHVRALWDRLVGWITTFQGRNPDEGPFGEMVEAEVREDLPAVDDSLDHRKRGELYTALREPTLGPVVLASPFEEFDEAGLETAADRVLAILLAVERIRELIQDPPSSPSNYLVRTLCDYETSERDPPSPDVDGVLEAALDFEGALIDRIDARLGLDLTGRVDPLDTIMAAPEFPEPTYRDLKAASEEYLLPGVGEVPQDSVGALSTNPAFIESFFVGLNHEMASELLWQRFPTDRRGSYFCRFWDQSTRIPKPSSDAELDDIFPIHLWDDQGPDRRARSPLGSNTRTGSDRRLTDPPVTSPDATSNVALLIRGELLDRYPNATIYAAKAYKDPDDPESDRLPQWPPADHTETPGSSPHVKYPVFRGGIDPDVTFLGFDLTPGEAVGDDPTPSIHDETGDETDTHGWFFVFEEPPGDPQFGLDEPVEGQDTAGPPPGITYTPSSEDTTTSRATATTTDSSAEHGWSALTWGHLTSSGQPTHVDVTAALPGSQQWAVESNTGWLSPNGETFGPDDLAAWGTNGGHMARITWQTPVRIAIHADDLLPGGSQ